MRLQLPADPSFSLAAAARFAYGFPGTDVVGQAPGTVAWGMVVDGDWRTVGVSLSPAADGVGVDVEVTRPEGGRVGAALAALVERDLTRILCLDADTDTDTDTEPSRDESGSPGDPDSSLDATGGPLGPIAARDPVVAGLVARFPGLRPVLFSTPYDAAVWALAGHRIRTTQAVAVRRRLAETLGEAVDAGGRTVHALPAPDVLATQLEDGFRGLMGRKPEYLRALGEAAAEGLLDRDRLRAMDRDEALAALRELPGVGPFSAELILIRGVGDADGFPENEPRIARAMRAAYGLDDDAPLAPVAEAWRPYRSWVSLLLRADAAGPA